MSGVSGQVPFLIFLLRVPLRYLTFDTDTKTELLSIPDFEEYKQAFLQNPLFKLNKRRQSCEMFNVV